MNFISRHFHIFSLSPVFLLTLGLIVGILCQSITTTVYPPILSSILAIFLIGLKAKKIMTSNSSYSFVLFFISFSIGSFLYQNQVDRHEQFYSHINNMPIDIVGTITDISRNNHKAMPDTITLQLKSIKKSNSKKWDSSNKIILIYTNHHNKLWIGDIVMISNIQFKDPQDRPFVQYLIKQKIAATLFIDHFTYSLQCRPYLSLNRWIFNQKQRLFKNIEKKMSSKTFLFFSSLFLGNRTIQKEKIQSMSEQFKKWGISHLLARSGIHLTIFIFTWQAIFSLIPLSFALKQYILILISIVYFIFSWPSISFIRAFSIFMLYQLCTIINRPTHFLHFCLLTCFLFLIFNPMQLFFLDFQLSFSLTFVLGWFNQLYQRKLS